MQMKNGVRILSIVVAMFAASSCQSSGKLGATAHAATGTAYSNNIERAATAHINTQYSSLSALDMAKRNPELSILVEAVEASGISSMLSFAGGNYTIFAPSNAAFESLFHETKLTKQTLMANKPLLRMLLGYHVMKTYKPLTVAELPQGRVTTFVKKPLSITAQHRIVDGQRRMASITGANITTRNGQVHVIDTVLFPAE